MYRIFIVEDDSTMAAVMKKQIESWGHSVHVATQFSDILSEFTAYDPHMVLMDVMLPFFNGYHWCSEIRKISNVPVMFISSVSDNMNIVMAMNMGGDDFIAKPVDLTVMMAKIQAMLRRTYDMGGKIPVLGTSGGSFEPERCGFDVSGQATRTDEKRVSDFTDAVRAERQNCQSGNIDDEIVAGGFLCGGEHLDRQCDPSAKEAGANRLGRMDSDKSR